MHVGCMRGIGAVVSESSAACIGSLPFQGVCGNANGEVVIAKLAIVNEDEGSSAVTNPNKYSNKVDLRSHERKQTEF